MVTFYQEPIETITPNPGWVEQDPNEILNKTILCIEKSIKQLEELGYQKSDIKGRKFYRQYLRIFSLVIGVTNQRETTILWDKNTGKPLHNALIWLDARTQETVAFLLKQYNKDKNCLQVSERVFFVVTFSLFFFQGSMWSTHFDLLFCIENSMVNR